MLLVFESRTARGNVLVRDTKKSFRILGCFLTPLIQFFRYSSPPPSSNQPTSRKHDPMTEIYTFQIRPTTRDLACHFLRYTQYSILGCDVAQRLAIFFFAPNVSPLDRTPSDPREISPPQEAWWIYRISLYPAVTIQIL